MRRSLQRLALTAALPLLVIGLSACTGAPSTVPTSEPTSEPTSDATVAPSTEPTETAAAATCDTVLTDEAYAKLDADGLTPRDTITHTEFIGEMLDAGALGCRWGKEATDITLDVAQLAVDDAAWPEWEAALATAGYTLTNDPVPGAYTGPVEPGSGISPVVVRTDGAITFLSAPTFAAWVAPTGA
jgi:hypothetical protein